MQSISLLVVVILSNLIVLASSGALAPVLAATGLVSHAPAAQPAEMAEMPGMASMQAATP